MAALTPQQIQHIHRRARAGLLFGLLFATILLTAVGLGLFFTGTLAIAAASTPVLLPVLAVGAGVLILVSGLVGYWRNKIRATRVAKLSAPVVVTTNFGGLSFADLVVHPNLGDAPQFASLPFVAVPDPVDKATVNMLPEDGKRQSAVPTVSDTESEPDEKDAQQHTQDGALKAQLPTELTANRVPLVQQQVAKPAAPTTTVLSSEPAALEGSREMQAVFFPEPQLLVMQEATPGEKPTLIDPSTGADCDSEDEKFLDPEESPTDVKADGRRVEDGATDPQQETTTTDEPAAGWGSTFSRLRENLPSITQAWEHVPSLVQVRDGAIKAGLHVGWYAVFGAAAFVSRRPVANAEADADVPTDGVAKKRRLSMDSVD